MTEKKFRPTGFPDIDHSAAKELARPLPTEIYFSNKTPQHFIDFVEYVEVPDGIYNINKIATKKASAEDWTQDEKRISHYYPKGEEFVSKGIPTSFIDLKTESRTLKALQSKIVVSAAMHDMHSATHGQVPSYILTAIRMINEERERLLLNDPHFGLDALVDKRFVIKACPKKKIPSSDYLDAARALNWKDPDNSFFICHPEVVAQLSREMVRNGAIPRIQEKRGSTFMCWRGVPILPTDKLPLRQDKQKHTVGDIYLIRSGSRDQGGYVRLGKTPENVPCLGGTHIRKMDINDQGQHEFHFATYLAAAVQTSDAIAKIEGVRVKEFPNVDKWSRSS